MGTPFAPETDGLIPPGGAQPDDGYRQAHRKRGDDVGNDFSKMVIKQADSDAMLAQLKAGACLCEDMDELPAETHKHPINRLHFEQLHRQRPRGPCLTGKSDAPHMTYEPLSEEERFRRKSGQYAYKVKYVCTKCGSEWLTAHDYWWNAGAQEAITGNEGQNNDCLIERFQAYRTLAGPGCF